MFFALRTATGDGARYIPELQAKGVKHFVTENALEQLQAIATANRRQYDIPVVAITGSHGKTIVKEWLAQLLIPEHRVTKSPRSYNSQIGVALSLWEIDAQTEIALIEAGISQPGEMARLERMIAPTIGILTALGSEHDENFTSREAKREEKLSLFVNCEETIVAGESWSMTNHDAPLFVNSVETTTAPRPSARVTYTYAGRQNEYVLALSDDESIAHSLTCALAALRLGLTPEQLAERMPRLTRVDNQGRRHIEVWSDYLQKTERVHETTMEISLTALAENACYFRQRMAPGTLLTCMIKADAYGCGATEVAKTLQECGVDYLAVAVADEGVALRRSGITQRIMVMNPEMSSLKTLCDYQLEPEVNTFRMLRAIEQAVAEAETTLPVHIKLDTGMARLGFSPETDIDLLINELRASDHLNVVSVFSHFVGADSAEHDAFSTWQFERFDRASRQLQEAFPEKRILRHICNSAGILRFADRQLDMCRLGIGLYGINPIDNSIINNVATLRTTILQIREMKAGESVGYSRRTVLDRDARIAVIPIGYADGLDRHLGNRRGHCLVKGQRAEYVGNICMDICMIDITDIANCQEGDSVEIFGSQLPVTALSDWLDTIPYEVLTGISPRVKRIYFEE